MPNMVNKEDRKVIALRFNLGKNTDNMHLVISTAHAPFKVLEDFITDGVYVYQNGLKYPILDRL